MPGHTIRAIGIIASTYFFICITTPKDFGTPGFPQYFLPLKLGSTSKFYKLFSFQFRQSSRDLPLFFLPSRTGCALVALLGKNHHLIRDDESRFATSETRTNSNEEIIYIFGFNNETMNFDLLLKRSGDVFYGAAADTNNDIACPDLIWVQNDHGNTLHIKRYKYHPERMRYVPR